MTHLHAADEIANASIAAAFRMVLQCVRRRVLLSYVLIVLVMCVFASPLQAQTRKKKLVKVQPFIVVCVASFDRLLDDTDYLLSAAGRPELSDFIAGTLADVRDLKGIDRKASAGTIVFLDGLLPEPVAFVPVTDLDQMLKSATTGPVTISLKEEGLYEILGAGTKLFMKVVGKHAYVGRSEAALNKDFADPAEYTRSLSASYDVAASINLRAVPRFTRDLLLATLRATVEASIQRRDHEGEARFRMRKAAELAQLEVIELFATQMETGTVGFNLNSTDKVAFVEAVVTADPKSELARLLNELGAARSQFTSLLSIPSTVTVSASLKADKIARKYLQEWIDVSHGNIIRSLERQKQLGEPSFSGLEELLQSVDATLALGELDAVIQLVGTPPGPYTMIAALKFAEDDLLRVGLEDALRGAPTEKPSDIKHVQTRFAEHRDVVLHRLELRSLPDATAYVVGQNWAFYVGVGTGTVWFAMGGDEALPTLRKAIDTVVDSPLTDRPILPVQFVVRANNLLDVMHPPPGILTDALAMMRSAFDDGGGTIRAELLPLTNGLTARLTLDEGFIKLAGRAIIAAIEQHRLHLK